MHCLIPHSDSCFTVHSFNIELGPLKKIQFKKQQKPSLELPAKPYAYSSFLSDETFIHDSDKWLCF